MPLTTFYLAIKSKVQVSSHWTDRRPTIVLCILMWLSSRV